MTGRELMEEAIQARNMAYTPYSHFQVGAALLTEEGKVYRGCNIENAAYGSSMCAERTALFKAVSEGERKFAAIAIAGGSEGTPATMTCPPCGSCRQCLREFCSPEFVIYLQENQDTIKSLTLTQLLPESFGPETL